MDAAQLNVRMDRSLKLAGDAVLAAVGSTPSRAVRALWEYLATQARLPSALEHTLMQEDIDAGTAAVVADVRDAGANLVAGFYERVGVSEPARPAPDYEALRDDWARERLDEWGLS